MRNFFHNNKLKLLIAAVFLMFGVLLYTASQPSSWLSNLFSLVTTPMQQAGNAVTGNATDAAAPILRSNESLLSENEALKKQVEELQSKLKNYNEYQLENAQLRQFLELKKQNPDFKLSPAAVVARDPSELFGGFLVDKGSLDGIKVGDPVFVEAGVVGKITQVNATSSRVVTFLSPENNLSALDSVSRESGVISCDLKLADQNLLRLNYLTAATTVKAGDLIITSGAGGVYPAGLKIGEVVSVENAATDVSLYALIRPFADVKTLRDVMIITSFRGQGQALETPLQEEPVASNGGS